MLKFLPRVRYFPGKIEMTGFGGGKRSIEIPPIVEKSTDALQCERRSVCQR